METNNEIQYTLEELQKKLTEKERIFCHQYIIDWNGARSAREAGYSETSAREIASQNLAKLHIRQYINLIKNNLEEEAGISKLGNLKILIGMATKAEPDSTKVAALKEINSMMGYNETTKIDLTTNGLPITLPKLVFDDLNEG